MGTISFFPSWTGSAGRLLAPIGSGLSRAGAVLAMAVDTVLGWQRRAAERTALATMDDRMLRDVGLTQAEAMRETDKPFWKV